MMVYINVFLNSFKVKILSLFSCLLIIGCEQKPIIVSGYFNSLVSNDTSILLDNKLDSVLQIYNNRNLIYFLNGSCSVCISQFVNFIQNINDYQMDSLLVVASETYDFLQTEFYLKKFNLKLPSNTRIVFDPKNKIFVKMANIYGDKNIFLIEDKRILYKNNVGYFKYDEKYGYTLDPNQKIKK